MAIHVQITKHWSFVLVLGAMALVGEVLGIASSTFLLEAQNWQQTMCVVSAAVEIFRFILF